MANDVGWTIITTVLAAVSIILSIAGLGLTWRRGSISNKRIETVEQKGTERELLRDAKMNEIMIRTLLLLGGQLDKHQSIVSELKTLHDCKNAKELPRGRARWLLGLASVNGKALIKSIDEGLALGLWMEIMGAPRKIMDVPKDQIEDEIYLANGRFLNELRIICDKQIPTDERTIAFWTLADDWGTYGAKGLERLAEQCFRYAEGNNRKDKEILDLIRDSWAEEDTVQHKWVFKFAISAPRASKTKAQGPKYKKGGPKTHSKGDQQQKEKALLEDMSQQGLAKHQREYVVWCHDSL